MKNLNPPEGFSITFRIPEGNSKKAWKPKRNMKNLYPPEEFCITFRIPEGNSNLAQAKKEEKRKKDTEENRFLLHISILEELFL